MSFCPYRDTLIIMGKGISKQQGEILQLLEEQGKSLPKFPWMSTREIVMALHPDVEAYLAEERRYSRWIHRNMLSLSVEEVHRRYQEHLERLKALPNYHTVRTSINRALRGLAQWGHTGSVLPKISYLGLCFPKNLSSIPILSPFFVLASRSGCS